MEFGVFFRWAPTIDVAVYNGSEDARGRNSNVQFFEEGASIAFQVLICPLKAIVEDINILTQTEWEVVIVDECQQLRTFSFMKNLRSY